MSQKNGFDAAIQSAVVYGGNEDDQDTGTGTPSPILNCRSVRVWNCEDPETGDPNGFKYNHKQLGDSSLCTGQQ